MEQQEKINQSAKNIKKADDPLSRKTETEGQETSKSSKQQEY
jgi:hypothetical protein